MIDELKSTIDALREELDASKARVAELEDSLSNMECDVSFWKERASARAARVAELEDSLKCADEINRLTRIQPQTVTRRRSDENHRKA
jgi:predicted nuclease with TOPRIM domain